jgi:hypothetical protein
VCTAQVGEQAERGWIIVDDQNRFKHLLDCPPIQSASRPRGGRLSVDENWDAVVARRTDGSGGAR